MNFQFPYQVIVFVGRKPYPMTKHLSSKNEAFDAARRISGRLNMQVSITHLGEQFFSILKNTKQEVYGA